MSTKAFLFFVSLVATVFCLLSCGDCSKKIDCPGYKDSLLSALFPYNDNQQLIFKTAANEQAVYTLKNTKTTEPYQAVGSLERAPSCNAEKIFESVEKDSIKQSLFTLNLTAGDLRYASFTIGTNSISFTSFSDSGFVSTSINGAYANLQAVPSLSLGNRNFSSVISAMRDTSSGKFSGIYKFWYTKTEGLVGYAEYPSLKTWVKQ